MADADPDTVEVTVVMPCLNEAETLAACIDAARAGLDALDHDGEILIADNGSTDGSQEIARAHGARVIDVPVRGYGAALQAGVRAARGGYVVMGDADMSYDFTRLRSFVDELDAGADLVMGNRVRGGIAPGAMPPLHRYLGNPVLSFLGRTFFGSRVGDFHCGLRAFRRDRILELDLHTLGMEFASEMVVKAALHRLDVREVATTLAPDGRSRAPHLRTWSDGWRHLRFLLLYTPRWLYLYPGALLMAAGLAVMLWLLPNARAVGGIGFDVQTLLYGAGAVIVGYQAILFAVLSKVFAMTEGLLPRDGRWQWLLRHVKLETGLAAGTALVLAGLVGLAVSFSRWSAVSFGPLDPTHSLRATIPTVCALVLGVETMFASFLFSLLGIRRRESVVPLPEPV